MSVRAQGLLYVVATGLVALLTLAATQGPLVLAGLAVAVGGGLLVLTALGPSRTAILMLMGAYLTAPFYKGVALGGAGSPVTLTDLLLLGGLTLLLPTILRGRVRFPTTYVVGIAVVFATGLIGSALASRPLESFIGLTFWMIVMLGLPVAIALWGPGPRVVDLLAVSFVVGQAVSLVLGIVRGNVGQGRQAGLSTHPNYLAQAGMLGLCLLIYLAFRYAGRSVLTTAALVAGVAVCLSSVWMSGSRAGIVVVAGLVVLIPIAERSALLGFLWATLGALVVFALPSLVSRVDEDSPISRLLGGSGSSNSDAARSLGLEEGIDRFLVQPLTGSGLIDLFDIHNNFVEVLVAIGVFGFAGYLMVLYVFAKPLFGSHPMRRLCYATWGYIAFGATVPSLYDRSVWLVVALGVLAFTVPLGGSESRRPNPLPSRVVDAPITAGSAS